MEGRRTQLGIHGVHAVSNDVIGNGCEISGTLAISTSVLFCALNGSVL